MCADYAHPAARARHKTAPAAASRLQSVPRSANSRANLDPAGCPIEASKAAPAGREWRHGPDNLHTLKTLTQVAGLLRDRGDSEAARLLFNRILSVRKRTLGTGIVRTPDL